MAFSRGGILGFPEAARTVDIKHEARLAVEPGKKNVWYNGLLLRIPSYSSFSAFCLRVKITQLKRQMRIDEKKYSEKREFPH